MKIMVVIPIEQYNAFLSKVESSRPECQILKNGVITRSEDGAKVVEIACDLQTVERLLDLAARVYAGAAAAIQESIRVSREL